MKASIVSRSPGRMRVRLEPSGRNETLFFQIKSRLQEYPEIAECESNLQTGSILIRHGLNNADELILASLSETGVHIESEQSNESIFLKNEASALARNIGSLTQRIDNALFYHSGRNLDLRTLYPLGIGSLGLYLIARNGLMLSQIPGLLLVLQAIASFQRLLPLEEQAASY